MKSHRKSLIVSQSIVLRGRTIDYFDRVSRRAKSLRLAVYIDGRLVVTRPFWLSADSVRRFIREKADWIIAKLDHFRDFPRPLLVSNNRTDYLARREEARQLVSDRLAHFNKFYNFKYQVISIRNQATRWGSCSKKGNLNFNYRLLDLPPRVADYIVVHELCHLKEFNHSTRFWSLVAQTLPDYKELRRTMRGTLA